jgi:hypothetical protein
VTIPVHFSGQSTFNVKLYSETQKLGAGWNVINENKYFNTDELPKEVEMTTSDNYAKAYIQLMTMQLIEVVLTK